MKRVRVCVLCRVETKRRLVYSAPQCSPQGELRVQTVMDVGLCGVCAATVFVPIYKRLGGTPLGV